MSDELLTESEKQQIAANAVEAWDRERESSFAASGGSLADVHFEIKTEQGNTAMIKGDPNMPEATRKALAEMIDAAVKAANAGELKAPENSVISEPCKKP